MQILHNLLFIALLTVAVAYAAIGLGKIKRNIQLGRPQKLKVDAKQGFRMMLLMAFGQKRMFDKPIVGFLHFLIYSGFLVVNFELLEIVIDGIFGTHRIFLPILGKLYPFFVSTFEIFGVAVIISCVIFLIRRNVLKIDRFHKPELTKFPILDANTILVVEIILMAAFLSMNSVDLVLQTREEPHYKETGNFLISGLIKPFFEGYNTGALITMERVFWWTHIVGIFWFLNYLPYSKHLHIILAFPNTWYGARSSYGHIDTMPVVTREVYSMLGIQPLPIDDSTPDPLRFGAKDVTDLSWKNLMDAYTCTECGRCTEACPANQTGKLLSPRKIMMDTRDRMETLGKYIDKHGNQSTDDQFLLGDYIKEEEILACTTCQACVEVCPVHISPLEIIIQLRRYKVMEESSMPQSWVSAFSNIENNAAPWKFSPSDRFNWAQKA